MIHAKDVVTACPECGVSVFRHEGKHYTPLRDYLLSGDMFGRDCDPEFRRAYIEHRCSPEDLERYENVADGVVEALKQLIEDNPPQWTQGELQDAAADAHDSYAKLREVTARTGLTRECPRCGAAAGSPCENLLERRRGNTVQTKNPHEERTPLPETVAAAEVALAREEAQAAYGVLSEIQEALKTDSALEKLLRLAERC